ncbi:MAG: hypothetical protein ACPG44_04770 [Polaribacter sp.]
MDLKEVNDGLPIEVTNQLMIEEKVYYFSHIAFEGGCGSSGEKEKYWLALTDRRVMYKTKILEGDSKSSNYIEKDGDLPFKKISFIEVSESKEVSGCSSTVSFQLRISSSGGTVIIPLPTKQKGYDIRKIYSELNQE